jgi:hypothetical protein
MRSDIPSAPLWFSPLAAKLRFVLEAQRAVDGVVTIVKPLHHPGRFAVTFTVDVPGVAKRRVRTELGSASPDSPRVFVDGPSASPHRYGDGSLCMWFPYDPDHLRWSHRDGAATLIGCVALHLVREQWWRDTGEWVGPEAPHELPAKPSFGSAA